MHQYKMTDLGPAKRFLGLEIGRSGDSITLGQQAYIEAILHRFNMQDANTVSTPVCHKIRLDAIPANEKQADIALYQSIVGSLMWAALGTRPDIAYAVAALSRYTTNPYMTHMTAAKRVLRYLKGTSEAKIHFPSRGSTSAIVTNHP